MSRYTTIFRGSERHVIESDRLQRFLEAGWTTQDPKKSTGRKSAPKKKLLPKVEIKAEAEVNQKEPSNDDLDDVAWDIQQLKEEENDDVNTNR